MKASDATHLHAVQYYFDARQLHEAIETVTSKEKAAKWTENYNAYLTQNANVILTELRYLLSYQRGARSSLISR